MKQNGDVASRLASILGTHLKYSATELQLLTDLADKTLNPLLWMELISGIEQIFDVSIDLSLTEGSRYGDFCNWLVKEISRYLHYSRSASSSPLTLSSHSAQAEINTGPMKSRSDQVFP